MSLDALRGFDMTWIVGADALGHAMAKLDAGPIVKGIATQLDHVAWEGFRFYDLIFPLFVFMIGVAITFSVGKMVERHGRSAAVGRIVRRTALLYVLGLIYYGGISEGVERVRLLGVLQRLALCYGFTALCFVYLKPRQMAGVAVVLLVGYWALLKFVPVPGIGAGDFAEGRNLTNWIDSEFLPLRKWDTTHDPEGILSTLPAFASCLLGVFAGLLLGDPNRSNGEKTLYLTLAGLVGLGIGYGWGLEFPIVKKLWTSSFVLVAGGWSAILLALFYFVIDVLKIRAWAMPFVWVGTNALTIYLVSKLVDFDALSARFVGGPVGEWLDAAVTPHFSAVVVALVGMAFCFLFCRFLYRRQIFLRL